MTLSDATKPSQSRPRSHGNEGVLDIHQSSSITETSQLDCLVSYPGHSLEESYPSAEMQSVYSTAPTNKATHYVCVWEAVTLCRDAVGVFCSPSRLSHLLRGGLTPVQRCSQRILQAQPTWPLIVGVGVLPPLQ